MSPPQPTLRILLLMGTSHGYGRLWIKKWSGDGIIVRHHPKATCDMMDRMKIPYLRLNYPDHPSDLDVDEVAWERLGKG